jgi:hypothetical protein
VTCEGTEEETRVSAAAGRGASLAEKSEREKETKHTDVV